MIQKLYDSFHRGMIWLYHRLEVNEVTGMLILGLWVGVLGGFGAVGFRLLIEATQTLFLGIPAGYDYLIQITTQVPWWRILLAPALGGLIVGPVIVWVVPEARGSGIPEVLEAIVTGGGVLRARVISLKPLLSALTIGSGGSAGREGPIVELGSAIGSMTGQFLELDGQKIKTLVGSGAAAGIAGTFNAPIAGMLFSLEILLEDYQISQFSPILVASVSSTVVSQAFLGPTPAFAVPTFTAGSHLELGAYLALGVLCGLLAVLLTNSLYGMSTLFDRLPIPSSLHPAVGGLCLGGVGLAFPAVLGLGYEAVEQALNNELGIWMLGALALAKILATVLTLGSGGSGGVFAPSLYVGAMTGGAFGYLIQPTFPTLVAPPESYTMVGMGALVAGTAHAPLTATMILFEMTRGNYLIILPLLLACITSTFLAQQIQQTSIYTLKLARRGLDIRAGKETNVLQSIKVNDAMKSDPISIPEQAQIEDIHEVFARSHHTHYPVTENDSDRVVGVINYTDYWDVLEESEPNPILVARDLARTPPITVRKNDNLLTALNKLTDFHVELLPVVSDTGDRELVGVLSRNDIINAYNQKLRSVSDPARSGPH